MTRHSVTATAALFALVIGSVSLPAFAEDQPLGDLTVLPANPAHAKPFLAAQPADTRRVILASCERHARQPDAVRLAEMPETAVRFCAAIMG